MPFSPRIEDTKSRYEIMYESDITKFIRELKQQKPHLEAEQIKGTIVFFEMNIER